VVGPDAGQVLQLLNAKVTMSKLGGDVAFVVQTFGRHRLDVTFVGFTELFEVPACVLSHVACLSAANRGEYEKDDDASTNCQPELGVKG
jgi:hypothetical protein